MNKRRRSFDVLPMKVSRDAIDNTIEVLRGTDARVLQPIFEAMKLGVRLLVIDPGEGGFFLPLARNGGLLYLAAGASGPHAFDEASLRRAIDYTLGISIVASPTLEAFAAPAGLALISRNWAIAVETTERFETEWVNAFKEWAPTVKIFLTTSTVGPT